MLRRVLLYLLIAAMVAGLTGCSVGSGDPVLELVSGDATISLTLRQIQKMPAVEGMAGIMTSTGRMVGPFPVKGVLLTTLLRELGGDVTPDQSVLVAASDGYAMTLSASQVLDGEFITYDPGTGDEIDPLAPLQVILAYEQDGKPLDPEADGNLRLVVVSDSNLQVIDGHWSVKWVNKLVLQDAIADWTVDFVGGISEPMDRATFESGAQENCHYQSWTDDEGREWIGIPLYYLLGRVDDEVMHGEDAYRDDLARAGYTIDVIAADGYSITLDSSLVTRNDNIIVAYLVDGQPLSEGDFPLRLVGSELTSDQMIGAIAKVVINFPESAVEKTNTDTTPAGGEEPAVTGPADAKLVVKGCDDTEVTLTMADLMAMSVVNTTVEHPKKGSLDVTGVRMADVLALVTVEDSCETVSFTANDGYKVDVPMADLRACADCLVGWDSEQLATYMPGFEGSFWAKDLASIQTD
jgi:DMSO/TMAO reductase YedYZ molybdopterin-dependent catalytic subunit